MVKRRRTLVATLGAVLAGCSMQMRAGYFEDDRRAAEAAMETLHKRLSDGQFEQIYNEADKALQDTAPKADLLSSMRATHSTFGSFVRSEVKAAACFPNQVRFVCHAEYEKGSATEMFTWAIHNDGKAHLVQLQISPGLAEVPVSAANNCKSRR